LSARWRKIPQSDLGFSEFKFMALLLGSKYLSPLLVRYESLLFQPLLQRFEPHVFLLFECCEIRSPGI
jgi:hypothetical protein